MRNSVVFLGMVLVSTVALGAAIGACSSTTTSETAVDASVEAAVTSDAAKDTSSPPKDSAPTDPDEKCAAEATQQACGQCCLMNHAAGYQVFATSLSGCACTGTGADGGVDAGGGPCANECAATFCKSPPASVDMACQTCLQTSISPGGSCQETVAAACQANADCVAQQKCILPCSKK